MNILKKAVAKRALFSSSSPTKCRVLVQTITTLQESYMGFSTTTRGPKPRNFTAPKPLESSFGVDIDESETITSRPKPSEIPYQAKVANSVNLMGFVQNPIQFEASPDGKYWAGTVLAHDNTNDNSILMIPVVFEGDLAHVVANHVKQNDCVYVSGKFSSVPLPSFLDEYQGSFHIVAENVNFVQGLKRKAATWNTVKGREELVISRNNKPSLLGYDEKNIQKDGSPITSVDRLFGLENDDKNNIEGGDDWSDLVKNPHQWWDWRKAKIDGTVKAKHPDFKNKNNRKSIWLTDAPRWVLERLQGLEFDVYAPKFKGVKNVSGEGSWKDLLENPDNWWDKRANKSNQKAPDFKHKNTGIGLWLNSAPDWVSSRLQPLKDTQTASSHN